MTDSFLGPLCAFGSSVTWAIGSAGYARLSSRYSPFAVNFTRALVALPLFVSSVFLLSGGWQGGMGSFAGVRPYHWGLFSLSMFASYGLGDSLFLWATRSLGVPAALAIASCYPLWTVLLGFLFDGTPIFLLQGIGIIVTVLGLVLVILNGFSPDAGGKLPVSGILLAFGTSLAWALNSVAVSHVGTELPASVGNTIRMGLALPLCAGFGRLLMPGNRVMISLQDIFQSSWVFVLEGFFGSICFVYGLSHSPLALGATLSSLAPAISLPIAGLLGMEKVSIYRSFGVGFVVVGVWLLLLYK